MALSTLALTEKLPTSCMVLTHIPQQLGFSAGFVWVIPGEQLALIKRNTEDLVNDLSPFFSLALWDGGKQTATQVCTEGPSSLPQLPDAKMMLINRSALYWNRAECVYTADAYGNPLSKKTGGEWQNGRKSLPTNVSHQLFSRPNPAQSKSRLCSLQNTSSSTVAWRAPHTANTARLGLVLVLQGKYFKVSPKQTRPKMGVSEATGFLVKAPD